MYEWIDPFAKIEELQAAIPRARAAGQRYAEEKLSEVLAQPFSVLVHRELNMLAEDVVARAVPLAARQKMEEAMVYFSQAQRLTNALAHTMGLSMRVAVRVDAGGEPRFTTEMQAMSQRNELLQLAYKLMAEATQHCARYMPDFDQIRSEVQNITGIPDALRSSGG